MMKFGKSGQKVLDLQRALMFAGFDLPKWGADGEFGAETAQACQQFLSQHGRVDADGDVSTLTDVELNFIMTTLAGLAASKKFLPERHNMVDAHSHKKRYGRRSWKQVTGITLHQTACVLGENPQRWLGVGCHYGITRAGKIIQLYELTDLVVHGNGFNKNDIGIEIDGMYSGVEGQDSTFWKPAGSSAKPQKLTPESVEAAWDLINSLVVEVQTFGGKLKFIHAHRQASASRRPDPGSAIWKAIALPLLVLHGMSDGGENYTIGGGLKIPKEWNPLYSAKY